MLIAVVVCIVVSVLLAMFAGHFWNRWSECDRAYNGLRGLWQDNKSRWYAVEQERNALAIERDKLQAKLEADNAAKPTGETDAPPPNHQSA